MLVETCSLCAGQQLYSATYRAVYTNVLDYGKPVVTAVLSNICTKSTQTQDTCTDVKHFIYYKIVNTKCRALLIIYIQSAGRYSYQS